MVFSSLLFIYIFLPVNLICYAVISDTRKKNLCILLFSLIFYAWTSPAYLILLVLEAFVNYVSARLIEKYKNTYKAVVVLILDLVLTLGALGYFKYADFLLSPLEELCGIKLPKMLLPVGISFYTFQLISYVVDVFRGDVGADRKFTNVCLYTALFHQCIAGPIVRYSDISQDLSDRKTGINDMSDGISRFCTGLAKKTLLANSCGKILETVLPENILAGSDLTILAAWMGALLFMLQLYLDFSAYSDMAIGLGKMMGFNYKENFNYPYIAESITDFWRRWHISLGTFFRDYVYIPLGGNRNGIVRQLINMFVVWLLTGLWHGAAVNFVVWGLYYFLLLAMEKLFLLKLFAWMKKKFKIVGNVIARVYTLFFVVVGWVIFRFEDMSAGIHVLKAMFGLNGNMFTGYETNIILINNIYFILICVLAVTPVIKILGAKLKELAVEGNKGYLYVYNGLNLILPIILLLVSTIALVGNSYNPFIYFRF